MEEFDNISDHKKKKLKRIRMIITIILCVLIVAALIYGTVALFPIFQRVQNDEEYRLWVVGEIRQYGSWSFLVILGAQIVQSVLAIIPASPIVMLAGVLFEGNPVFAIFVCVLGQTLGGMIVYGLVKLFGYRFLAIFIDPEKIKNSNLLKNKGQSKVIMSGYLMIPALPKDIVAFIAPFTKIDFISFTLISFFARIPMTTVTVMVGTSLISGSYGIAVALAIVSSLVALMCFIFNEKIVIFLDNLSHKIFKHKKANNQCLEDGNDENKEEEKKEIE